MPVSGSYYYPQVQVPNSSYPSVDLRGLASSPTTAAGIGRLYVLSGTNDLYYKDADGNVIAIAAATGSAVFDTIDANLVYNSRAHLILSSSVGSRVTISGNLTIAAKGAITATAGHLVLSSSAGSIVSVSGGLNVVGGNLNSPLGTSVITNFAQWTANGTQIMTLASANGSVGINPGTGYLGFSSTAGQGVKHYASTGHLVLSSSTGTGNSIVAISGGLKIGRESTATLPTGADTLTGSIIWDETRKALKVYGPLGWTVVATGTVG